MSKRLSAPSGTLVFLFSDIEGSTRRWEADREAMQRAVERHEAVVRRAIDEHDGYIFKTLGDAFCCAFASADKALRAALTIQTRLGTEDFAEVGGLAIRIALHAGVAQERDRDYFGPAVNRVARLMSIGHGGQVLLSNAAYELVRGDPPAQTLFIDLGSHRLKDLSQPERVWQALSSELRQEFPPLLSVAAFPNNLPLQVTSFYGREDDIAEIKRHLADHHLITIFGAGGVGKTRLAIQSGAEVLDRFRDGVWIADLAPINEDQSVVSVVAQALGVNQSQGVLDPAAIVGWLEHKQLVLILDNCEHVLDPVARLVDAINRHCSDVRILVTSRQALGVGGEKVFRLPSLAVPEPPDDRSMEGAMRFSAVALFVDRAGLADRSFHMSDDNARLVADVCRRLDGIPLAIELAAARLRTMSCASLARHLGERFKLLTGGNRSALPRQQTLSAMIDWSYDLLKEREQAMFDRLAVFAGSFTLEAAEQVCAGDGIDGLDVLDVLSSLADKSLIVSETEGLEERYHLLESTRDYAFEKLKARNTCERWTSKYAGYYAKRAAEFERSAAHSELSRWLADVENELPHFRAVLEWSLGEDRDAALGASLAAALETFWWHGGAEA
ncbi:MAG TPA: adenylate/guanylate cyclase domain-containing protein, partial [Candidatus Acidoferrales bacterium]|nr:adenylate/guanylate cyclase domain-containing protein [Candidatus Acidoferrales bacterium]